MFIQFDSEEVEKFIDELEQGVRNVKERESKFMNTMGLIIYKDVIDHFEKEMGPDGKWKPWSDSYSAYRKSLLTPGKKKRVDDRAAKKKEKPKYFAILQFSGRMRQNFKATNYRTSGEFVYWYNNVKSKKGEMYSGKHDEGIGVPKREFMYLSENAKEQMLNSILQYILRS